MNDKDKLLATMEAMSHSWTLCGNCFDERFGNYVRLKLNGYPDGMEISPNEEAYCKETFDYFEEYCRTHDPKTVVYLKGKRYSLSSVLKFIEENATKTDAEAQA